MERKTEHFFDGTEPSMTKIVQKLQQYPQEAEKIIDYVIKKVEHFTEFRVKKEYLKHKYDKKLQELYADYMTEDEE